MNASLSTVEPPADRLARRTTAVGVGFLVLLPAWQLGLRLASLTWQPPVAPIIAMAGGVLLSMGAAWIVARRLRGQPVDPTGSS